MGEVQWIKLYTGMFSTSRKVKQIEHMNDGDTILIIWFKLLCLAGDINDGGTIYITSDIPYDIEMLSNELRRPPDIVEKALVIFEQFDMIQRNDDGFIWLLGWEKYQNIDKLAEIREKARKRVAKCREKKVSSQGNVTVTLPVTPCNAVEEDKEKKEDKELHSFTLSAREEEEYLEKRVEQEGFTDESDADAYREELKEGIKRKYIGGELGQGIVLMSDEQFNDLCDKLSLDEIEKYFGIIVECENKGKCYKKKTHYQAILDMARKDRRIL